MSNQDEDDFGYEERADLYKYKPANSYLKETRVDFGQGYHPHGYNRVGNDSSRQAPYQDRRTVDDPTHSWVQDFALRPVLDMQYQASKVVTAINQNRPRHAITAAKRSYLDCLETVNLCFRCRCPIRVIHSTYMAERRKVLKRSISCPEWTKRFKSLRYDFQLRKNLIYADVQSHYEWFWVGSGKAIYRYIDGTDRDIRLKRTPITRTRPAKRHWERKFADKDGNVTKTRFVESFIEILEDGTEVPVIPESKYRIFNLKCECKFRRRKTQRIKRV